MRRTTLRLQDELELHVSRPFLLAFACDECDGTTWTLTQETGTVCAFTVATMAVLPGWIRSQILRTRSEPKNETKKIHLSCLGHEPLGNVLGFHRPDQEVMKNGAHTNIKPPRKAHPLR